MLELLDSIPVFWQCVICAVFCFLCTTFGALLIFAFKNKSPEQMCKLLAFAGGIMIASSFFSLLSPAIEACEKDNLPIYLYVAIGFLVGGIFIVLSDKILDKFFNLERFAQHKKMKRAVVFTGSIIIHNIPEGMAVGVAFGSIATATGGAHAVSAMLLALGIGIQNIPEGLTVALPLRAQGVSAKKAFCVGTLSGSVEPIFAVLAFALCFYVSSFLPFLLSFAAGAMVAVATCELIPEAVKCGKNKATVFMIVGFAVMALLDTAFQ